MDENNPLHILKKILSFDNSVSEKDNVLDVQEEEKSFKFNHLKKLFPFILPHRRKGLFASFLVILGTIFSLPQPLFTKYIIDDVIVSGNIFLLAVIIGIFIVLMSVAHSIEFLSQFYFFRFQKEIIFQIQHRLFNRVLRFPKSFFDSKQTGYLMSRLSGDVLQLRLLFSRMIVDIFANCLKLLGGLGILFFLHWKLTLLALVILPLLFLSILRLGGKVHQISHKMMEKAAFVSKNLQESLSGVNVIKAFATEEKEVRKISKSLRDSIEADVEQSAIMAFSTFVVAVIGSLGTALLLWFGSREVINQRLTLGGFVAFNSYLVYLYGPSTFLANINVYLQPALAAFERVFKLFGLLPEDEQDSKKIQVDHLKGNISFKNIYFSYDHQLQALSDVSFKVKPGEKIAIVGPTGAGKSTLIHLIMRLYNPSKGNILYDGLQYDELSLRAVRERIGIVSQNIFLFNDTIINNIRYGKPNATEEEVIRIAKLSRVHDFVVKLPDGYNTTIGERGERISVGEKQRISIARALIKDPDILIFDEPTSALDAITETAIKEALFERTNGKTTFIIAHRLSTVTSADKIIVLDKGQIVQMGNHDELIQKKGLYRRMCEEQLMVSG